MQKRHLTSIEIPRLFPNMLQGKNKTSKEIKLPPLGFCDAGISGLRSWVEALPKIEPEALAKELLKAGNEIKNLPSDTEQLIILLEEIDETITFADSGLKYSFGSNKNQQLALVLQQQFYSCFGQLYLTAGLQLSQPINSTNNQAEYYMTMAGNYLAKAILRSKQAYSIAPKGCWLALHTANYNLINLPTKKKSNNVGFKDAYKAVVALSCASPEKLSPLDLELLFNYVLSNSELVSVDTNINNLTRFSITTTTDTSPQYCIDDDSALDHQKPNLSAAQQTNENTLYFSFDQLVKTAEHDKQLTHVHEHLKNSLIQKPARSESRVSHDSRVSLCIGLSEIHYCLTNHQLFKNFIAGFAAFSENENRFNQAKKAEKSSKDVWDRIYTRELHRQPLDEPIAFYTETDQTSKTDINDAAQIKKPHVLNQGTNGICLVGKRSEFNQIKPGTLIGFKQTDEENCWQVAIVRWIEKSTTKLKFGAEIIPAKAEAAAIKLRRSNQSSEYFPALCLMQEKIDAEKSITPLVLFANSKVQQKTAALLIHAKKQQQVILSECIDRSPEHSIFMYRYVENAVI